VGFHRPHRKKKKKQRVSNAQEREIIVQNLMILYEI
jgi:hypothetical protein